jgi:5-formyltetrahydrofolate cyclo-ligase
MKVSLSLIDEKTLSELSFLVSKNLFQLFTELNVISQKICIGAYAPIAKEPIVDFLTMTDVENLTAYPAYVAEKKMMTFKMAKMSDLEVKTDFGPKILGPKKNAVEVCPDLVLVPGIAFGEKGERLGRGKGFYDRYLSHFSGIKIGIGLSVQVLDEIPMDSHDVHLDYLVTEKKWIKCKKA